MEASSYFSQFSLATPPIFAVVVVHARLSVCVCILPPPLAVFLCSSSSSPNCSTYVYVFRVFALMYLCVCVYLYFPSSHPPTSSVCMCYMHVCSRVCVRMSVWLVLLFQQPSHKSPLSLSTLTCGLGVLPIFFLCVPCAPTHSSFLRMLNASVSISAPWAMSLPTSVSALTTSSYCLSARTRRFSLKVCSLICRALEL